MVNNIEFFKKRKFEIDKKVLEYKLILEKELHEEYIQKFCPIKIGFFIRNVLGIIKVEKIEVNDGGKFIYTGRNYNLKNKSLTPTKTNSIKTITHYSDDIKILNLEEYKIAG